jgi:hypothetical protein
MINPLSVLIAIPCYDGKVESITCGGIMAASGEHLFGNIVFIDSVGIRLARNLLTHKFINGPFEWLVFIDADIGFTARDFKILMDYPEHKGGPPVNPDMDSVATTNGDGEALIVNAEYSRKVDTGDSVRFGLGFTRIHKSVFARLDELNDAEGAQLVRQFMAQGQLVADYYLEGAQTASNWTGEDTGFFMLCRHAGIVPRIEQRCSLIHVGRKQYPYFAGGAA